MTRLLAPLALLLLCACARQEPAATPPAPPPAAQESPAAPAAPAPEASAQSQIEQATHSQESADGATDAASDASLEKITTPPAATPLPPGKWQSGVNYNLLVPAQPTSVAPGKVEVTEVFWLACPHCYAFEPFLSSWLKTKPAYVQFVRVPVMWQAVHKSHAHLYYTLEALGREDLIAKAFETIASRHEMLVSAGGSDEETFKLQQQFASSNGVSADDFAKAYNSFSVNSNLQRATEITQRYQVQGVPFIIINGKYTTDLAMAGGDAKLIELINDLTAAEHHH